MITTLAERLAIARKRAGLRQAEVAAKLGLASHGTISQWETGNGVPTGEQMMLLPGLYGVSGHWLLTGEGSAYPEPVSEAYEALEEIARIVARVIQRPVSPAAEIRDVLERQRGGNAGDSGSQRLRTR